MNKLFTCIIFLLSLHAKAQLFSGTGGAIQDNGQDTYFNISVSALSPAVLDGSFGLETVCININHPTIQELFISLKSPSGELVELTAGSNCSGNNYTNTCFNSNASTSITLGNTPYSGMYKPTGSLGRFNNGQSGNGVWQLVVHDYLAFVNSGSLIDWSIQFGNSPTAPVSFTSSNLPIVIINTNNQSITDTEVLVTMGIIDNGPGNRNYTSNAWNNYNAKTTIHIRGNTSKNYEKKSFALETRDGAGNKWDVSLLGMPADNDWALTASYADKTLIRNSLTYDLSRKMGHYSPRTRNVEVVINNEYQGVYELMEKPKQGKNRIDVAKLTSFDNTGADVTGGYILKIDRTDVAGWYSLLPGNSVTNSHFYYEYVYPKDTAITVPQMNYIKSYVDSFETATNSPDFAGPNGYRKYINSGSFIDFFIINELSKNVDAYRLSTYLYKDKISKGGKLNIGPVWDYDIAWHNCNYGNSFDPTGWEYQISDSIHPSPTWWSRFLQDSIFVNSLHCRWNALRQNILSNNSLYAYIDSSANALNEPQQRNFTEWPIIGANIFPNPQNQLNATYQGEVNDLKAWVGTRTAWLDANMPGVCNGVGITENQLAQNTIYCFPNPFRNNFSILYNVVENANVKIELLNLEGEQVMSFLNSKSGVFRGEIVRERVRRMRADIARTTNFI